jgi:hypothetical protein
MRGAIPLLPQYTFMAWCSVKKKRHRENFNFMVRIINDVKVSGATGGKTSSH